MTCRNVGRHASHVIIIPLPPTSSATEWRQHEAAGVETPVARSTYRSCIVVTLPGFDEYLSNQLLR